jgi:hypothetical protein
MCSPLWAGKVSDHDVTRPGQIGMTQKSQMFSRRLKLGRRLWPMAFAFPGWRATSSDCRCIVPGNEERPTAVASFDRA